MFSGIEPYLRLRKNDQFPVTIRFLLAPKIDKAGESAFLVGKRRTPYTRQLGAVEGAVVVRALEETLVKQLDRPSGGEITRMTIVGSTDEGSLLITAGA